MRKGSLLYGLLALMAVDFSEKKKIKIWLIGDSTMSIKEKKAWPETGRQNYCSVN